MELNYYALCVSILCNCIPETAFEKLQADKPSQVMNWFTPEDVEDMAALRKQGLTFRELGEIYCVDLTSINRRLSKAGLLTGK